MHQRNGMNAVVMQIRPVSDAFYPSQYEPWSEYLNGKQGLPPTPYYDPLEFMIAETHKRGMEFHAWLNPYRAVFSVTRSSVAPSHVKRLFPQWFLTYGNTKYFDPGVPQAREHVNRVVTRFKVASSGAGVAAPLSLYGVDQYINQYINEIGLPWKDNNIEKYLKLSYPFLHADRIKTPTQFMVGEKDFNVPAVGSEQMYQALRSVDVPTELLIYPNQFHGFTQPSFIKDRFERYFTWFDKYLKPKSQEMASGLK